jgi:hypothetical protein
MKLQIMAVISQVAASIRRWRVAIGEKFRSGLRWLKAKAELQIPYTLPAAVFRICFFAIACYWWKVTPPSGYAVAALAFAAAFMAVRGTRFTRIEEVAWILIAFALFVVEIAKDRTDFADQEGKRRQEENAQFQRIVGGLTESLKQSQKQFAVTMEKSNRVIGLQTTAVAGLATNLDTLTGADSFCYLGFTPGQSFLPFTHVGKFPLYGVSARIAELDQNGRIKQHNLMGMTVSVGDMIKGHVNIIQTIPSGLGGSPDYFNANVFFAARNGDWMELLRVRRVN